MCLVPPGVVRCRSRGLGTGLLRPCSWAVWRGGGPGAAKLSVLDFCYEPGSVQVLAVEGRQGEETQRGAMRAVDKTGEGWQ